LLSNRLTLPVPRLASVLRRRFDSLKWDVKKCEDIVFDLQVGVSDFTLTTIHHPKMEFLL
jgi:hypothetical protein